MKSGQEPGRILGKRFRQGREGAEIHWLATDVPHKLRGTAIPPPDQRAAALLALQFHRLRLAPLAVGQEG